MSVGLIRNLAPLLTQKARMISEQQLVRHAGHQRRDLARVMTLSLVQCFIQHALVLAAPLLSLEQPLVAWELGQPAPDFGAVSYQARNRWRSAVRPVRVYFATEFAARLFGGHGGRIRHPLQATHDLHVMECFLMLRARCPALAECWLGEDSVLDKRVFRGGRFPDAVLFDSETGRPFRAIEFAGSYSRSRIQSFHESCLRNNLPYELW